MMRRRDFIKQSTMAGVGTVLLTNQLLSAPTIFTRSRTNPITEKGELVFKPYIVQTGKGPHLGQIKSFTGLGEKEWNFPAGLLQATQNGTHSIPIFLFITTVLKSPTPGEKISSV